MIGDQDDIENRLVRALPPWFGSPGSQPTVLRTILAMPAAAASSIYALIDYARRQTRIATAEGGWLDLIAFDFFARRVRRKAGQSDVSLRARIKAEMFRPRGTRPALRDMLLDLTGREPSIFEPARPADTGGWGSDGQFIGRGLAYNTAGAWGSLLLPAVVLVDAHRSPESGIPGVSGWGDSYSGWSVASSFAYVSLDQIEGALTDADIIGAVDAVRPAGVTIWVRPIP